jgi:hypothetical protein
VDASSPDEEFPWASYNSFPVGASFSTAEMLLLVMRYNETRRQDIIAVRDTMDRHTGELFWASLVDFSWMILGSVSGMETLSW